MHDSIRIVEGHREFAGRFCVFAERWGRTQCLHQDGTWHALPMDEATGEWSGYFATRASAEGAALVAHAPTTDLPPVSVRCPHCCHIYSPGERHECPTLEYLGRRDRLIADAAEWEEMRDLDQ